MGLGSGMDPRSGIQGSATLDKLWAVVLYVYLTWRDYYACDAGCLDPPVKLGPTPVQFPVKVTEPLTAILYITGRAAEQRDGMDGKY